MFNTDEKRKISSQIQEILRNHNLPELPKTEIQFAIHVEGAEYCDLCKTEIPKGQEATLLTLRNQNLLLQFDLCESCISKIKETLGRNW